MVVRHTISQNLEFKDEIELPEGKQGRRELMEAIGFLHLRELLPKEGHVDRNRVHERHNRHLVLVVVRLETLSNKRGAEGSRVQASVADRLIIDFRRSCTSKTVKMVSTESFKSKTFCQFGFSGID